MLLSKTGESQHKENSSKRTVFKVLNQSDTFYIILQRNSRSCLLYFSLFLNLNCESQSLPKISWPTGLNQIVYRVTQVGPVVKNYGSWWPGKVAFAHSQPDARASKVGSVQFPLLKFTPAPIQSLSQYWSLPCYFALLHHYSIWYDFKQSINRTLCFYYHQAEQTLPYARCFVF